LVTDRSAPPRDGSTEARTSDIRRGCREHLLVVLGRHVALEGAEDYIPPPPRRATHNYSSPETPGWFIPIFLALGVGFWVGRFNYPIFPAAGW